MADERILIVGGSGFIGKGIQKSAMDMGWGDLLTFSYHEHPDAIHDAFKKVHVNLLDKEGAAPLKDYKLAIFVAGQGNQALAAADPLKDNQMNVELFLNFMRYFRGSAVILSSQAVYQGLQGEVDEKTIHIPKSPFGISNRAGEAYADYFFHLGWLRKLWLFRLLYAYGPGEMHRRLLPMCAWAASNKGKVTVHGGGKSYLNPLRSDFVGQVLMNAADIVADAQDGSYEVFNLSHPKKTTTLDVVKTLAGARHFDYNVASGGEEWPSTYWGETKRLTNLMKQLKMEFPDVKRSLIDYFMDIQSKPIKKEKEAPGKKEKKPVVWPV